MLEFVGLPGELEGLQVQRLLHVENAPTTPWFARLAGEPWAAPAAHAQTAGPTVHIHSVDEPQSVTPESGGVPGLFLRTTFSLLDANSTILESEIENATLRLGGDVYTGKFTKLENPWSIVLLLDTSATLYTGRAFTDFRSVRDALTRSLESAPDGASFALIPYTDRAPTAVEFTADTERITNALKSMRPEYGRPACLNDALYEAIAKLSSAPGRRAVLTITASTDSCATRSVKSLVEFAGQNLVELYAVGIDGYTITRQELEALSGPTGGLAETRNVSQFTFALDNLMGVLANQWQGVWVVYPPEGEQTAEVNVKLPDATVLAGSFSFVSDRSYARPPTVAVAGTAQSTVGGVRFNLDIINPDRIGAIDIDLVSKLTGRSVYQERLTELSDSILLPADDLVEDGEYTLTLTTLDEQGQVLSQTQPLDFRFEPLAPGVTATVQEWPTAGSPFFVISAAVQNLEGVAHYRMWLEQDQGSAPIRGTEVTVAAGQELRLPVDGVRSGSYQVRLQALDQSDRVLVEVAELTVAYQAPGAIARLVASLKGSTVAVLGLCGLGVLAAVGLGALGWYLSPKGKGAKNVELVLPEKARRTPPPAAPAPVSRPAAGAEPAPSRPAAVRPPRPSPPVPAPPPPPARSAASAVSPKPSEMLATIRVEGSGAISFHSEIRRSPFRIGRAADNDGVLPVDATSGVSGHHCVISFAEGGWHVQDKSKFGTTVNGQAVPKGQPVKLQDGVVLGLGPKLKMRFQIGSGSSS